MPYNSSGRLPYERASKIGHLEVVKSELVQELLDSFYSPEPISIPDVDFGEKDNYSMHSLKELIEDAVPLDVIFAVDGSKQIVGRDGLPEKELAFIKTALVTLQMKELAKIDRVHPHPKQLRNLMEKSALYHSTVIPLRNIRPKNMDLETGIRHVIYDSIRDPSLKSKDTGVDEVYATLKWLIFEEWKENPRKVSQKFHCPYCNKIEGVIKRGDDFGICNSCKKKLLVTDFLAFHLEMDEEGAYGILATSYMLVHETLLLFTAIRYYWENDREFLNRCLFVKDGGLYIRAHYSKLVQPIRNFIEYAKNNDVIIHLIGQEKSGPFVDFLDLFARKLRTTGVLATLDDRTSNRYNGSLFIPKDHFIRKEILGRTETGMRGRDAYGKTSNYGAKIFVILPSHNLVLTIATGQFKENPVANDLLGLKRILATILNVLSFRFENGLLPIELANAVASLSTYPSAHILELFAKIRMHSP